MPCSQPFVREEILDAQLSALLSRYVMPPEWATEMLRMAAEDEVNVHETASASVQALRSRLAELDGKLARLTDLFVEQDIERGDYLSRKAALMSEKKSAQEQILRLERNAAAWLEPMREWVRDASLLDEIRKTDDLPSKKYSARTSHSSRAKRAALRKILGFLWPPPKKTPLKKNLVSCLVPGVGLEPT